MKSNNMTLFLLLIRIRDFSKASTSDKNRFHFGMQFANVCLWI